MEKNTWKCQKCGYTFEAETAVAPPETCPGCKDKCEFLNVSCYIPDCGKTDQDPRLG
jgi:rubrerythrin